jgi:hypothetical protein
MSQSARIYVLSDLDDPKLIKIGISQDPTTRCKVLSAQSNRSLRVSYWTLFYPRPMSFRVEQRSHERLRMYRAPGSGPTDEWFRCGVNVAEEIVRDRLYSYMSEVGYT